MKLKAKKYRTPQPFANPAPKPAAKPKPKLETVDPSEPLLPSVDEQGETPDIGPLPGKAAPPPDEAIDAIRREGLTGRQLRMARRTAQRHGIAATSDFDAVRLLREKDIDPFQRTNMLDLKKPDGGSQPLAKIDKVQLPQTVADGNTLPSTEVEDPAQKRATEIERIQRDITKRRQKRMALLGLRLAFFVGLPTLICGWYFYFLATPLYATKSSFLIQQNEAQPLAQGGGLGGLLGGGGPTIQDSIAVQGYLTSTAAMKRLDKDLGFKSHFASDNVDPLSRLDATSTDAAAYKLFQKFVKIGYDPTEGIINMEVIASTPKASEDFSKALIGYAEEEVSDLTLRLREDQMKGARESFEEAEEKRAEALNRLTRLQRDLEIVDPISDIGGIMGQIATLETEMSIKRRSLASQLNNRSPNAAKVSGLRLSMKNIQNEVDTLRSKLTEDGTENDSIATKTAQLRAAEADYETRNLMLQTALTSLETTRIAADKQARFISTSIPPSAPDEPTYPRKFENTILSLMIFGGIYLLMSLTASILREQV